MRARTFPTGNRSVAELALRRLGEGKVGLQLGNGLLDQVLELGVLCCRQQGVLQLVDVLLMVRHGMLDERAVELTNKIAEQDALIAATQRKLASSETDNAFLTAELQKQMAKRAELERNFNDLNVVRAQVKKLRDELFVTRRLQWMANGVDPGTPLKGGAVLMQHNSSSPSSAAAAKSAASGATPAKPASQYDLNVEVGSDGSVHVIPAATNGVAH